jgi:hypothetical protein
MSQGASQWRPKSYEEAARLIDLCLKRRPEDVAVWHARLDWAVATNRVPLAQQALKHLPEAELGSAQIERLAAWFAAQHGDDEAEQLWASSPGVALPDQPLDKQATWTG